MSLITQKKEKKITYKEQVINLDMEIVKEINNYCRIAGITKGKAEERREFFIQEAIKRVLEQDKEIIRKMREEKKKWLFREV